MSVLCLQKDFHQVLSWSFNTHFAGALSEGKVHYPENKAPTAHLPLWCALLLACVAPCQWATAYSTLACPWPLHFSLQRKAQQTDRTIDIWERSRCTHGPRKKNQEDIPSKLNWVWLLSVFIMHTSSKNDKGTDVTEASEDLNVFWRNRVNGIFPEVKVG